MKTNAYSQWDWPSAVLLILAVFTAAVRLDTTNWTPDLGYVESLAVLGVILGLALGISQFKRSGLCWLIILYSLFVIPMHLSRIITGEKTALGQLASLGGRLLAAISFLLNSKAIEDHIFFVTLMSILFWAIGIYSGYKLVRGRAILQILLPSTLPILIIQYYDGFKPDRIWGLAFYFFMALMLAGRINLLNSTDRWETQHVMAGSDLEFDLNKNIASVAAVIILAAWLLPAPAAVLPVAARAWRSINEPFDSVRKRMDDVLAALNSSRINNTTGELYGDEMGLGRTAGSGETEFFSVHVPKNNLPRLYWRMRAYDTYQNGSWQTLNSRNTPFDPDKGNFVPINALSPPFDEFTFTWRASQSAMLVTPSLPVWTSRKGSIQTILASDSEIDLLSWSVSPNLETGDQYQVRALLPDPTQKELRASGNDYPDWVKERYLQLPKNITSEYSRLAAQITAGLPDSFDKAEAVTEYLRQNITYSETVPAPPAGVDPLSWFLFRWKRGFCNYYASAEVLLLRSAGIPARMVVGFAQGKKGDNDTYSVRGQDAHAWPEVYFPEIGWVQFEPTVNQAALVRPSGESLAGSGSSSNPGAGFNDNSVHNPRVDQEKDEFSGTDTIPEETFLGLTRARWLWIIIPTISLIILGILGWRLQRRQSFIHRVPRALKAIYTHYNLKSPDWVERWMRWSEVSDVERAFHAVNLSLTWLDRSQPDYATPGERAMLLKQLLPVESEDIDILSTSLEQALYTPHPADANGAIRASWRLLFFTVRKILRRWLFGE